MIGALVLLKWGANARSGIPTFGVGAILGVSVITISAAYNLATFAIGLMLWELAVNVQSTRLQATVVNLQPVHGGLWLPAAIAVGAGIGPAIHGVLLSHGAGNWFVAFSVLSGLLPAAWISYHYRRKSGASN